MEMELVNVKEVASHVKDADSFHLPFGIHIDVPQWMLNIGITKYIIIEVLVAAILIAVFVTYARKIKGGKPVKGRFWNMVEAMLLYVRDNIVRPSIGKKEVADRFLPYIWTLFFFVLGCNLLGLVPGLGSPTGSIAVTVVFALSTFAVGCVSGMRKYGVVGYWIGQVPHIDVHPAMGLFLKPMLFLIEVFGLFVKHCVLAIRLLANMFAGHTVIAVVMAFLAGTASFAYLWYPVALGSLGFSLGMNLLELLVAFIQAYIISFLSALYIGMAIHQH